MDLAANRTTLLNNFSDELVSDNRPELCILIGDHIHRGGGRLKLELQHRIWFNRSVVTRMAVSRYLLPCFPLELLARWDVNFLMALFLMHYEPLYEDVTESLVVNLKTGLLHPFNCRLRALQRWTLVTGNGDLVETFKRGLEENLSWREFVCASGNRKLTLLKAVENLQILHERLREHMDSVKQALRNYQVPSKPSKHQTALETLIDN